MTARAIDCHEAMERLYEYLDGELTTDDAALVRQHLEACAQCDRLFDFEASFLRFLEARARARGAPPGLRRKILDDVLGSRDGADD